MDEDGATEFANASPEEQLHLNWKSAQKLWGKAYLSMCPRCNLDGYSCGFCKCGKHICACDKCKAPCKVWELKADRLKAHLS